MIRTKGEAGTGNVVEAVRHTRAVQGAIRMLQTMDEDELLDTPLPGLMDICANLLTEDGIDAVIPGRQAVEQRVVSQDLELWLTNAVVADGYNLLARAGRQVQEIHVVTGLNRDSIKLAIKRATSAIKK